jgi:hypothetical protein
MRVRLGAGQQAVERSLALIATTCGSGGAEGALKVNIGEFELILVRAARGDGEVDAADAALRANDDETPDPREFRLEGAEG